MTNSSCAGGNPPDGGLLAWLQVLGGFLVIFNAQQVSDQTQFEPGSSCTKSYGVFQAYYEAVLLVDRSPSSIAWIGSIQIFFLFFMSILVSPLMDRGYFRLFQRRLLDNPPRDSRHQLVSKFWELLLVQGTWIGSFQTFFLFSTSILVSPLMDRGCSRLCPEGD
ncbi:hypothetical protein BDR22DRAFT_892213 [Usnea florida]